MMNRPHRLSLIVRLVIGALLLTPALSSVSAGAALASRVAVAPASPLAVHPLATPVAARFDVVLRDAHPLALHAYLAAIYDPASPDYHHFLTPAQFAHRFGPSPAAATRVAGYLRGFGLRVAPFTPGDQILRVSGSEAQASAALASSVRTVRAAGHNVAQLINAATLPVHLAGAVASVVGLSGVVRAHSHLSFSHDASPATAPSACPLAAAGASPTSTVPNTAGAYLPAQQAALYGLNTAYAAGHTGQGQTIALFELGTVDPRDIYVYDQCYGITSNLANVNVDGGAAMFSSGFSAEATIDVEEIQALAPGANLITYSGPNISTGPLDVYQAIAQSDAASIVSTSWGVCEAQAGAAVATAEAQVFEQMAAQGQTVFAAAGDTGAYDCGTTTPAVDDPASQPYVTGVGGLNVTSLVPFTQSVWNSGTGAGGGGVSSLWARPSWQNAPGIDATQTQRLVPDLSVMADPASGFMSFYTGTTHGVCPHSCLGGWGSIGGTSIGSPLMASATALAAQGCGVDRLGFLNPTLYALADRPPSNPAFVDVTSGSNDLLNQASPVTYVAGPGYDMASGLGSPDPTGFLGDLCGAAGTAPGVSITPLVAHPGARTGAQFLVSAPALSGTLTVTGSGQVAILAPNARVQAASTVSVPVSLSAPSSFTVTVRSTQGGPVTLTLSNASMALASVTQILAGPAPATTPALSTTHTTRASRSLATKEN